MVIFFFFFLFRQVYADDEALTKFLQIGLSLILNKASLMSVSFARRSSNTFSIHIFFCLPLLLVPSTCPYSAIAGSLFPSILVTCPNHVSLLFLILIVISSFPSSSISTLQKTP